MLHEFITTHRQELIALCREKLSERAAAAMTPDGLERGVPLFLEQLTSRLRKPESRDDGVIEASAAENGAALHEMGFTIGQVVHAYGDVCQAVMELSDKTDASVTAHEFHTFNHCLDEAIAHAVTEYEREHERANSALTTHVSGTLAHELRNRLSVAMLSFSILKRGNVAIGGSTGAVLGRSLKSMRDLIRNWLAETRLEAKAREHERVSVFGLIEEMEIEGALEATERGIEFAVTSNEHGIEVNADPQLLAAAVGNLMHNAFKFTCPGGKVSLRTRATHDRVLIEVEDECGGLPVGKSEELFRPFEQRGSDRSGLGLGLAISRASVEASGGEVRVRDLPGKGCVFTVDLPRQIAL